MSCGGSRRCKQEAENKCTQEIREILSMQICQIAAHQQNVNCVSSIVVSKILRSFLKRSFLQSCTAAGRYFFLLFVFQATRRNNVTVIKVMEGCVSGIWWWEPISNFLSSASNNFQKDMMTNEQYHFNSMQLAFDELNLSERCFIMCWNREWTNI